MYISVICVSAERWSVPDNYCCVMCISQSAGVYLTITIVLRMCISRSAGVYLTITVVFCVAAGVLECT